VLRVIFIVFPGEGCCGSAGGRWHNFAASKRSPNFLKSRVMNLPQTPFLREPSRNELRDEFGVRSLKSKVRFADEPPRTPSSGHQSAPV
jgi:hypothetical protein